MEKTVICPGLEIQELLAFLDPGELALVEVAEDGNSYKVTASSEAIDSYLEYHV